MQEVLLSDISPKELAKSCKCIGKPKGRGFYRDSRGLWVCAICHKQTLPHIVECDDCEEWKMPHKPPDKYGFYTCEDCENE